MADTTKFCLMRMTSVDHYVKSTSIKTCYCTSTQHICEMKTLQQYLPHNVENTLSYIQRLNIKPETVKMSGNIS